MDVNSRYTQRITVRPQDSAASMGSGSLDVFATPALVAYMENTAVKAVEHGLDANTTTVGTEINVKHLKASPVGENIEITASVTEVDGRKIKFFIEAKDEKDDTIGTAEHTRFIVDKERFLGKLKKQ